MRAHILVLAGTAIALVAPALGQTSKDGKGGGTNAAPVAKAAAAPKEAEGRFVNGSIVFMTLLPEALEVQTAFGKLTVPPKEIRAIEFGVHLPEGVSGKVEALVRQLAHHNYRLRD